jgi:hypothetical protein
MTPATREEAERAQQKLRARLAGLANVRGIGIAILDHGFGVKVNLERTDAQQDIPDDVDGVPVIVAVVGVISARQ